VRYAFRLTPLTALKPSVEYASRTITSTMNPTALHAFATRYTAAWCSQNPASVATHFSPTGSLTINGSTSIGREAVTAAAQSFMSAFPDMQVLMDNLIIHDDTHATCHWTLIGTNTGTGGTGHRVRISGYEEWTIGPDNLIAESNGHFDDAAYQHQLEHGFPGTIASGSDSTKPPSAAQASPRFSPSSASSAKLPKGPV